MTDFAEEILGMPVRIGYPIGVRGMVALVNGPQYATGIGLVKYGAEQLANARDRNAPLHGHPSSSSRTRAIEIIEPKASSSIWNWIRQAW